MKGLDLATDETNTGAEQTAAAVTDVEPNVAPEVPVLSSEVQVIHTAESWFSQEALILISEIPVGPVNPEDPAVPEEQTVPITPLEEPPAIPFDELIAPTGWSEASLPQLGADNVTSVFARFSTYLVVAGTAAAAFGRKFFRMNEV